MQEELRELIRKKDEMEAKIMGLDAQISAIDQTKNLGKGLIDDQGFPRADLDFGELANYRNLKKQKAMLNNDHLALMKQIQQKLHALHSLLPDVEDDEQEPIQQKKQIPNSDFSKKQKPAEIEKAPEKQKQYAIEYLTPFAKIKSVAQTSPAFNHGIRTGDLLSEFSEVNIYTMNNVKQIPKYVKEGHKIDVVILRQENIHSVTNQEQLKTKNVFLLKDGKYYRKMKFELVPQKWEGRGLLGCNIDPLQ